jgi:hypothetical protein
VGKKDITHECPQETDHMAVLIVEEMAHIEGVYRTLLAAT